MARFITGQELAEEVYDIIHDAKKQLLILSPYVKLDDYFKSLFSTHKSNSRLHLIVAFGKNERNPERSIKSEDLEYFKEFPNISIVFIPNLHAKYYANEKKGIVTSINLYDYSFKKNVEFGVVSESKFLGGSAIDKDAWESTMKVLKGGYAIFIRRPNYKKKYWGSKDYIGSGNLLDLTENLLNREKLKKYSVFDFLDKTFIEDTESPERMSREDFEIQNTSRAETAITKNVKSKMLSATNLGKLKNKTFSEVIQVMVRKGFIADKNSITVLGANMGLEYKQNKEGNKWIVYPESLAELL